MAEEKDYNVNIKRGGMEANIPRNELISISETPDGLAFKFKYGSNIIVDDPNMPSEIKQKICIADTTFKKGNLIINLNDYRVPITVNL
jgi:hypothetical protein